MRVAIIGCGYVGLALCRGLVDAGHDVVGVRRSPTGLAAVDDAGGTAVRADLTDERSLRSVPDVDAVAFTASPDERGAEAARRLHVDGLRGTVDHFAGRADSPDRLVYASSTGVYGDHGGDWVDESTPIDPPTAKTRVLAEAERVALDHAGERGIDGTVARLAGLYGPDRYRLDRYLEGPVTDGYLNVVHRDDAAGAIRHLVGADRADGAVVLVVDDEPVDKWTFADWLADQCGTDPPEKQRVGEYLEAADLAEGTARRLRASKRCANDGLRALGYAFEFPTYRAGYRPAVETRRRDA